VTDELDDQAWFGWWEREQANTLASLLGSLRTGADAPPGDQHVGGVAMIPSVTLRRSVAPALFAYLEEELQDWDRSAGRMALARLPLDDAQSERLRQMLELSVAKDGPELAGRSALALAVHASSRAQSTSLELARKEDGAPALRSPVDFESAPLLIDLALDGPLARRARRGETPMRLRISGALAAGLMAASAGNEDLGSWVTKRLLDLARDGRAAEPLRLAALVGAGAAAENIGQSQHGELARREWIVLLTGLLESRQEQDLLRGRAAVCLARVAYRSPESEQEQVLELLGKSMDRRLGQGVHRGVLSALVHLCRSSRELAHSALSGNIGVALWEASERGPMETRGPVLLGIARLSATSGDADLLKQVADRLLDRYAGAAAPERGWCALALGLQGADLQGHGEAGVPGIESWLSNAMESESSSEVRAALALAWALCNRDAGINEVAQVRLGEWSVGGGERLRTWSCLALGRGPEAKDSLRTALAALNHAPRALPIILGALDFDGDSDGVAAAARLLDTTCCQEMKISVVAALGASHDPRALHLLTNLLGELGGDRALRAEAAMALGRVGDSRVLSLAAPLRAGVDQVQALGFLFDQAGRGALQIR
jgi:hypothetical protein